MNHKAALITGGGRGIGRAISMALAASGYHVIINYKSNKSEAQQTLERIRESGGDGAIAGFDISDAAETKKAITEIIKTSNIEALINNAGITADGLFIMMPEKDWHSVIDTALNGFYNVTKPILKQMMRKKRISGFDCIGCGADRQPRSGKLLRSQSRGDCGQSICFH